MLFHELQDNLYELTQPKYNLINEIEFIKNFKKTYEKVMER